MTRTYAALQLLRHGALTLAAFIEITGWPRVDARQTLAWLVETGRVVFRGARHRGVYEVAA